MLRTGHGEKKISLNQFYNEYIKDKEHVHMNSTKWPSLTEFAKHLGREGICRVEEGERGLEVAWIDDSAEAIRRKEDIRKKDRLAKGDEDIESRLLEQQIKRAREEAERKEAERRKKAEEERSARGDVEEEKVMEPVKVSLSLKGAKGVEKKKEAENEQPIEGVPVAIDTFSTNAEASTNAAEVKPEPEANANNGETNGDIRPEAESPAPPAKVSLSLAAKKKNLNPLAKKNPFAKKTDVVRAEPEKKMSNAERIMKEELERKKRFAEQGGGGKRQRFS